MTITDQATAQVTITNHVIQQFGTFAVTKVVEGAGGYTGGTDRVFPVDYTCTLTGGPTTLGNARRHARPDRYRRPRRSPSARCARSPRRSTEQPGDFVDPSYAWSGSTLSPTTVTIAADTTSTVTLTNTYIREFGSLVIAKEVVGDGYLGGADENFTVGYDCGTDFDGHGHRRRRWQRDHRRPAGRASRATCRRSRPTRTCCHPAFDWGTPDVGPGGGRDDPGQRLRRP